MTARANNAEGGTNGVAVSAANSGGASGTAFNQINITGAAGGASVVYDSSQHAHGAMSIKCTGGSFGSGLVQWLNVNAASFAARVYVRFNAIPTALCSILFFPTTVIGVNATGRVTVLDNTGQN